MKFDDKLDIGSIVRDSFKNAMKTHGLVKEQDEQTLVKKESLEEFDPEKHVGFIQIKPNHWGVTGTFEADELDDVIKSVSGGMNPGLKRFKQCLNNMNTILGKKPGEFAYPVTDESEQNIINAKTLFSSLQLNNLLHSIIKNQDPKVAGKIYEGLVTRMVGGNRPADDDAIEDLVAEGGKLISLKLIDPDASNIKGSKYNLASTIAKNGEVTYLVCMKDRNANPFSFTSFSFTINKNNYFHFILKKEDASIPLNDQEIKKAIDSMVEAPIMPEALLREESEQKKFVSALYRYAAELGAPSGDSKQENDERNNIIKNVIGPAVESAKNKISSLKIDKEFFEKYLSPILSLEDMIPSGASGKNPLKWEKYSSFKSKLQTLRDLKLSDTQKALYFEDEPNNLKILRGTDQIKKDAILMNRNAYYNTKLRDVIKSIQPLYDFYNKIEKYMKSGEAEEFASNTNIQQQSSGVVNTFFTNFSSYKRKTGETQFDVTVPQAKKIAASSGADLDLEYPEFIVDSGFLFAASEKSSEVLKKWIEPIYRNFFYLDRGLKRYFNKDEIDGMNEADKSTDQLSAAIKEHPGKTGKKASELKENKKQPLTKHWSEIMLEELTK